MQNKLKLSAIFISIIFAILPFTAFTANAQTFDLHTPSFGLYCENQNADIHGNVKFIIDENGQAKQYSEYTINGTNKLDFKIPFISNAYDLPQIEIKVNEKAVTGTVGYGKSIFSHNDNFNFNYFYTADISNDLTGTLYTLKTLNERLTVNLKTYGKQIFIYQLPYEHCCQTSNGSYTFSFDNTKTENTYEIYALNGDFETFESNADTVKETLSLKEFIDRKYKELNEYYGNYKNIKADFFYALANSLIDSQTNCEFYDFFIDSITKRRLNAYTYSVGTKELPCKIAFTTSVTVQKNNAFTPIIYLTEQAATGNYNTDYTIELNNKIPFIIESSAKINKQSEYIYTAKNVTGNFYFVFSSTQKPKSIYINDEKDNLILVIIVILSIAICNLAIAGTAIYLHYKKVKNGNKIKL